MPNLKPNKYRERLVDAYIDDLLSVFGAVQIDGPKYCGKTWTAKAHANSEIRLDKSENRDLARADSSVVLKGERPRLVDEWQEVPSIRDDVRTAVDEAGNEPGQFLLTGSSVPSRDSYVHSGAGRIARVSMRPMSLYELGHSDGRVSLEALFRDEPFDAFPVQTALDTLIAHVCAGGWPVAIDRPTKASRLIAQQYLRSVFEDSAPRMGKTPDMARRMFRSLSRNNGTSATLDTIASDMALGEHDDPLSKPARSTVESYIDFYRDIYLLEELPGWDAPVRSKKRLRTKPKRFVVDPSLALSMLGMGEQALLGDLQTFGIMFENLCLRDLRVYTSVGADMEDAQLGYYRDDTGLEVDVVIQLSDGRWGCMEIKLSEDKVVDGVRNLLALSAKVAENKLMKMQPPSFLAVIVGRTPFARTTPEGVHIIPITSLTA
jgi:predicted AAA+ superfamily ATPase